MARIGAAFDMDVLAWSQHLTAERAHAAGARLAASKEELLDQSDVLSIHVFLSDRTRNLIGAPELARLRPTAYLVNTARAAIVDQEALIAALRDERIAGAGLDVFDIEPLPRHHPFPNAAQRAGDAAPWLRVGRELPNLLRRGSRGHRAFLAGTPVRVITTSGKATGEQE